MFCATGSGEPHFTVEVMAAFGRRLRTPRSQKMEVLVVIDFGFYLIALPEAKAREIGAAGHRVYASDWKRAMRVEEAHTEAAIARLSR